MVRKTQQTCFFLQFSLHMFEKAQISHLCFLSSHLVEGFPPEYVLLWDPVLPETELLGQPHFDATAGHECLLPVRTCACCSLYFWHPVPKKMVELSTDLAVGIYYFRMTESFPSPENSPMNSHASAKPLPSHQLKNNTLGFRKNAVLGVCVVSAFDPLRLCWCWVFRGLLHNWETSLQPAPEVEALRTSVRVRLSPIRLCNAANVRGSSKGLRNPRGPSEQNYRQTKRISTPTVTSVLEIPKVI